jgi:spoIIIJ-associated protein
MQKVIEETLSGLLNALSLPFTGFSFDESEAPLIRVDIASAHPSRIIGWRGGTLNALQHLVKAIVRTKENLDRAPFIVLDSDGYRKSQEDKVRSIAEAKAEFVRRKHTRVALPPMSPYFRRVVHLHIANTPSLQDLTTESIGEGDYRQIILRLKEEESESAAPMGVSDELSPVISDEDLPGEEELRGLGV